MHTLRFFRTSQDPGDPRRADVHIGFKRTANGSNVTGHAATVHPQFACMIAKAPEMLTILIDIVKRTQRLDTGKDELEQFVSYIRDYADQARALLREIGAESHDL